MHFNNLEKYFRCRQAWFSARYMCEISVLDVGDMVRRAHVIDLARETIHSNVIPEEDDGCECLN